MKKTNSAFMKAVSVLVLIITLLNSSVVTKAANTSIIVSKNYRFEKDITEQGVFGNYTFFFNVDEGWNIKNSYLNLVFTQSDILDKNNSTCTILLNNYPIYSAKLGGKKNYKENIKVLMPKEKIVAGFNEVKIKTYRRIGEKPCTDDMNSGNWIVFHKESYVHLDFEDKMDSSGLKEFPFPYMKGSDDIPANAIIVVPDNFKKEEITGAMRLCANFGAKRKFDNLNTKVYKLSEARGINSNNIIFIGSTGNCPKEILNLLTTKEKEMCINDAVIKENISPYNKEKKILTIISNNKDKIVKASKLLSSKELMKQINYKSIVVDDKINVEDVESKRKDKIFFSDLGYGNVILNGKFKHQALFTINIPKNRTIKNHSKVVIKSRYAKNLDFDKSLMTIYINDTPIGSKKLNASTANNDVFEIDIPEEVRDFNYYEIKVAFDLELKDVYCNIREEDNPWAYILNDSYVYLPYKNEKETIFENYPNPFVADGSFNDVTLVMPDKYSSKDLTFMGNLMAFIGHDLENNRGNINVVKSSEFSFKNQKDNIILIGTPENNSFIKKFNNNLYIKFNKDFNGYMSNNNVNLLKDYGNKIATLQFIESPYNKGKSILAITAVNSKDLDLAQRYLKDLNLINKLKGNAVIIDRDDEVKSLYLGDKHQKKEETKLNFKKVFNLNSQAKYLIIFVVFVMSFLVVISSLLIRKHKRE